MTVRLVRFLVHLYPPSWRRRYGAELAALVESNRLTRRVIVDVVCAAFGERVRALVRAGKGREMARSAILLAVAGAVFVYVSTMTAVPMAVWMWLNGGFAVGVGALAFVRARRHGWLDGFSAAGIGSAAFVAILVAWVGAARTSLVQLPFDHFDVQRQGSVEAYLAGSGFSEFAWAAVAGLAVTLAALALIAYAGAVTRRSSTLAEQD
jgi:hypothetical protein